MLLIIFMVVTPLLGKEEPVAVPVTPAPASIPQDPEQVDVSVRQGSSIFLEGRQVSEEELRQVLRGIQTVAPDRKVVVRGDRQLPYRNVRAVLRIVQEAGFRRVGLITERREV